MSLQTRGIQNGYLNFVASFIAMPEHPFFHADPEIKDSFSINRLDHSIGTDNVRRSGYHRIFLIEQGSGTIQIDHTGYNLSGTELFLLSKGQVYRFEKTSIVNGYELCFGDCFWEKAPASASNCKAVLFNNASANQHLAVSKNDYIELAGLFQTVYLEFLKDDYSNKQDALAAYLKIIMIKTANVNALLNEGIDNYDKRVYRQFISLVSKQYKTNREVADYALQLGISARKLTDLCKACSSRGAKDIITDQLVSEARRYLQFSSKPIKEIAFELNFPTPEQFSHFFKKSTLLSPNEYRFQFAEISR